MKIQNRIKQALACEVIELDEVEKKIYSGCGWKIAHFENGKLAEFFDPLALPYEPDTEKAANIALQHAFAWMRDKQSGEFWLVMCSGYELCEPRKIYISEAGSMAHLARVFGEVMAELEE